MENNCNRRPYHHQNDEQHKRQCNRFMAKLTFDKSISLIVLFVSVFLSPYQYQVLADDTTANDEVHFPDPIVEIIEEKTQLPEKELELKTIATINHETNASNFELNSTYTGFVVSTQHSYPHDGYKQLQSEEEATTSIPALAKEEHFNSVEQTLDVNNNIYTDVEERAENTILLDLVNSHHENAIITENLEESIRNSVKTEVELDQNLESSPVLEILKDLPEAEIRKTLTADIMSLDQETLANNFMLLKVADTENSKPKPIPEVIIESIENISTIVESSGIKRVNTRDSKNLQFQEAENSVESSNVPDHEQLLRESSKAVNSSLTFSLTNNSSDNSCDTVATKEKHLTENINQELIKDVTNLEEAALAVPEASYELPSKVNSPNSDFSIFVADETEDNALSIVLNETLSTSEPFSGEEIPIRIDDNVELTTEEQVETITMIPEELEHIVVKKVLYDQGIFEDISETTLIPFEQQTQKAPVDEESIVEGNDEDYFIKTEVFDDYNHDLSTKGYDREAKQVYEVQKPELDNYSQELNYNENDREAKLVYEDQKPKLDSKEEEHETKLVHEDQKPKLDNKEEEHETKLVHEEQKPELDHYRQELHSKEDDPEAKLVNEDQKPKLDSKEDEHGTKLVHEDQKPEIDNYSQELNSKEDDPEAKLVYEDQKPKLDSKEDEHGTILVHEDQKPVIDNYSQELNSKDDPEAKLVYEDQKPKLYSKNDEHETKVVYEDQNPELNNENTSKLVESKVKSSNNDEQSSNVNNINNMYFKNEKPIQHPPPYSENEQEPNKESQSLHNHLKLVEHTENPQNSENKSSYDKAATFFEAYLPRDSGQTFNNNLADEFAGIGKALPISISDGSSRSTIIIVLSSGTALLFVVISLTIFLISFQRQNGTLDIEMQERSCGKDDLDEEDVETFSKLLEVELPPSVALALDDTEECL